VVLLEVIFAVTLFVAAGAVILGGLNACIRTARDLRLEARGTDLAVTLLSEIQMGLIPAEDDGPTEYEAQEDESLAGWTWQIVTSPFIEESSLEGAALKRVEIVIANAEQNFICRLVQLMPEEDLAEPVEVAAPLALGAGQ